MNSFIRYAKNRILYKFCQIILIGLLITFMTWLGTKFDIHILSTKVYALENVTVYTNPQKSTSGKVIWYNLITPNTQSLGTVQSSASYGFEYFIEKPTVVGKVYKLKMNFNDYDYLHSNKIDYIKIQNYQGSTNLGECAVLTFQLSNVGNNTQYKNVEFTYTCSQSGSGIYVINQDQDNLTRISTIDWRLNSIQWEQLQDTEANLIIANASANTQNIINNQNDNTQEIINNQNENTQDLIQSWEDNTQDIIDSQKVCNTYNKDSIVNDNTILNSSGTLLTGTNYSSWGVTDYIDISNSTYEITGYGYSTSTYSCFYYNDKSLISCTNNENLSNSSVPSNASYIRLSILKSSSIPRIKVCKNGNQAIIEKSNNIFNSILDLPSKLTSMFINLFIPTQEQMTTFFNSFKTWFENKFGILGQIIDITATFLSEFEGLQDGDVIINIPDISVPNFEDTNINIVQATTFNWTDLIEEKESINNLWQLYLDFIDVFLWLAFLNYCYDILEGILGEIHIGEQNNIYDEEGFTYSVNRDSGEMRPRYYWHKTTKRSRV